MFNAKHTYAFLTIFVLVEIVVFMCSNSIHQRVAFIKWKLIPRLSDDLLMKKNIVFHKQQETTRATPVIRNQTDQMVTTDINITATILLYTEVFSKPWIDPAPQRLPECPQCIVDVDRNLITQASAVLFHGGGSEDLPKPNKMPMNLKPKGQMWLFMSMEAPINHAYVFDKHSYDGMFDWVATYARKSDFRVPYDDFRGRRASDPSPENALKIALKNDGIERKYMALWIVSNCNADYSPRSRYINHLKNYIQLDVYGKCTIPPPCHDRPSCTTFRRRYKFYMAFENTLCEDYVTEKYWLCVREGIIPVVMGGSDYSAVVIPGSYIDASDFSGPQDLASYLEYVASNDTVYNSYFEWHKYYVVGSAKEQLPFLCKICQALSDPAMLERNNSHSFTDRFGPSVCKSKAAITKKYLQFDEMKTDSYHQGIVIVFVFMLSTFCFSLYLAIIYIYNALYKIINKRTLK